MHFVPWLALFDTLSYLYYKKTNKKKKEKRKLETAKLLLVQSNALQLNMDVRTS